jgi:basic membrane lipoprotein Med (substrate-binding protein (PBP1-ABC) superfamily)
VKINQYLILYSRIKRRWSAANFIQPTFHLLHPILLISTEEISMKKNLYRIGLLFALLALLVTACAPQAVPTPETIIQTVVVEGEVREVVITATSPPVVEVPVEPYQVAVVMPSTITDLAFSQSFYEALLDVQEEMGGEANFIIAYSENMFNVPDAAAAIRDYAAQGFDLVIAHGSQYGSSLQQIAPDFPETSFAWGTSLDTFQAQGVTNVFAYQAESQEGGYVLGIIAALMSETGILGVCGPVNAGDAKLFVDGFNAGAKNALPEITVNNTFTGSFSDVSLMASAAETHIAAGADMLTGSSQSVVGAIGVAKDQGAYWFGTQWEQTPVAPDTVVATQVFDWKPVIRDMIASERAGVLGGKSYTLTFRNGGLLLVYNDNVPVSADIKAAAQAAIDGIMDGTIDPLVGPRQ